MTTTGEPFRKHSARRIDGGQPLREAMARRGVSLTQLSRATQDVDDAACGVSFQLIAFLATTCYWARETTTPRTAELIEDTLGVPRGTLFEFFDRSDDYPDWTQL